MPPPFPSSSGKPRPGEKPPSCLSAVARPPINKKIARPAPLPNLTAASKPTRPPSQPPSATRPPHQTRAPKQQSTALALPGNKKPPAPRPGDSAEQFMAPRDAQTVHPARRLAPGTAVRVRTRFKMITDKCCLVIWLPARVVSAHDAYHCTVKYSPDLSPKFAGKMARKPVDHVRVLKPDPPSRNNVKPEPRDMAPPPPPPPPQRKDRFF